MMSSVLTLQSLCLRIILNIDFKISHNIENCLHIYNKINEISSLGLSLDEDTTNIFNEAMNKAKISIRDRFPTLVNKFDKEYLLSFIPEDEYNQYMNIMNENNYIKYRLASYRNGKIIDSEKSNSYFDLLPDNEGYYPIHSLIAGVKWPKDVDICNREKYLNSNDFYQLFQMTKDEFYIKPKYDRIKLKKEKNIF